LPSGDSFPNFPADIKQVKSLELLGSPLRGDDAFFSEFISSRSKKVAASQEKLSLIDNPQMELHLLRSCLSSCKVIHLLRTVPFTILKSLLYQFFIPVLAELCSVVYLMRLSDRHPFRWSEVV